MLGHRDEFGLCNPCVGEDFSIEGMNASGRLVVLWLGLFLLGLAAGLIFMFALHKGMGTFIWEKMGWLWFGCTRYFMEKAAEKAAKQKAKRAERAKAEARMAATPDAVPDETKNPKSTPAASVEPQPPKAPHGAAVKLATGAVIQALFTDLVGFIQIESSLPMHSTGRKDKNPD